jgi:hypothetical protein
VLVIRERGQPENQQRKRQHGPTDDAAWLRVVHWQALIPEREYAADRATVVLVREEIGF